MLLLLALLAAGVDARTKICDKTNTALCASVGADGKVAVSASVTATATTTAKATAAPPTYTEGVDSPISQTLEGGLRISGTISASSAARATAANPSYTEGTDNPFSQDLSGRLRTRLLTSSDVVDVSDRSGRLLGHVTVDNASIPVTGTFWQATQPVSGTFWQATQPVSGTFWQANQPVTIQQSNKTADYDTGAGTDTVTMFGVALPKSGGAVAGGTSTDPIRTDTTGTTTQPVSGTFWQATQPVSGTFWQATQPVSIAAALDISDRVGRLLGHVTVDNASLAVTGTFWQATQPVSGTFWQATQPISGTVTANQGTANSVANAWPHIITDGTNSATVKAASTQPVVADKPLVVAPKDPDSTTGTNITATAQNSDFVLGGGISSLGVTTTGSWTGTITWFGSHKTDCSNAFNITGAGPNAGGAFGSFVSANGNLVFQVGSVKCFRITSSGSWTGTMTPIFSPGVGPNMNSLVTLGDGTGVIGTTARPVAVNTAQIAGTNTLTGGTAGSQGVGGLAADGAAVSGNPVLIAGKGFNGIAQTPKICDKRIAFTTLATTATVQQIALVAGQTIYVCGWYALISTATTGVNIKWVTGTGSNCATGITDVTPLIFTTPTAAPAIANWTQAPMTGSPAPFSASASALCITQSSATNSTTLSGVIYYTQN